MPIALCENRAELAASRPKIGRTIKVARTKAGLGHKDVRDRVRAYGPPLHKTHIQTLSNIERDETWPSPELLMAICEVLEIKSLPLSQETDGPNLTTSPGTTEPSIKEEGADVPAAAVLTDLAQQVDAVEADIAAVSTTVTEALRRVRSELSRLATEQRMQNRKRA